MFIKQKFAVIVKKPTFVRCFQRSFATTEWSAFGFNKTFLQSSHLNFEHKHYTSDINIASDQPNNRVNMGSYFLPEVQNKKVPIFRMFKGKQISVSLLMW